jgi:hypothetical protein
VQNTSTEVQAQTPLKLSARPLEKRITSAIIAGVWGTVAMTVATLLGPLMGLPPMDVPGMLAGFMGRVLSPVFGAALVGWAAHFTIGITFALLYAFVFAERLPGPAIVRGALYGLVPWLAAQLVAMPVMGMGLFALMTGSLMVAAASLLGHLIYGAVVGALYKPST